jgi:hypothetical protein
MWRFVVIRYIHTFREGCSDLQARNWFIPKRDTVVYCEISSVLYFLYDVKQDSDFIWSRPRSMDEIELLCRKIPSPILVLSVLKVEAVYSSETLVTIHQTRQKGKIHYHTLFSNSKIFYSSVGCNSVFEYFSAGYLKAIQAASRCQRTSIQTNVSVCPNTYEQVGQRDVARRNKTVLLCEYVAGCKIS